MFLDDIVNPLSIEEAKSQRMSAQMKLSRAWDREQQKSSASRERAKQLINPGVDRNKAPEPTGVYKKNEFDIQEAGKSAKEKFAQASYDREQKRKEFEKSIAHLPWAERMRLMRAEIEKNLSKNGVKEDSWGQGEGYNGEGYNGDLWSGGGAGAMGEAVGPESNPADSSSPIPGSLEEERLQVGDPVVVTGPNEFEGKTGEIAEFSPSGAFVIVDLYNHGKHSMHLSDVKYNQYADDEDEGVEEGTLNELAGYSSDKAYQSVEAYKRYDVYVSRKKFNNIAFIAVAENPRTRDTAFKARGNTPQEAVDNLKAEIDREIDVATKVSGQATLDFNVDFVKAILELSADTFYAKIIPGPRLVIAGSEMLQYPDIMKSEGFKPSTIRTSNSSEGTTPLPGVPLSPKAAMAANLIANGRYVLGDETVDRDGNRVFDLNFDSVVQASNDKMRLRAPAVTVGTNRSSGVAEGKWSNVIHTTDRSDEKAQREQEHKKQAGLAATVLKNHSHALDPKEIDLLTRYNLHHRGKPGVRFDRLDNEKAQQLIQNVLRFNQQGVAEAVPAQASGVDPKIQFLQPTIQLAEKLGYRVTLNPQGRVVAKLVNKQLGHIVHIGKFQPSGKGFEVSMADNLDWQTNAWSAKELAQDFKGWYARAVKDQDFNNGYNERPQLEQQGVAEDTGSWIVYDPETKQIKKRFKTHTAGKSYAQTHGLGFASSEYYFDRVKEKAVAESQQPMNRNAVIQKLEAIYTKLYKDEDPESYDLPAAVMYWHSLPADQLAMEFEDAIDRLKQSRGSIDEAQTDYSKRRQRERDVDAGKPVSRQAKNPQTDYARKRAKEKRDLERFGESTNYWTKLQDKRNTKLNSLVNELKESVK